MLASMTSLQPERSSDPGRPSASRFVQLAESGIVGLCIGNVHGDLLDANDAFLDLVGFSRAEFDAGVVRWQDRTPPEWAETHRVALDSLKRTGAARPWKAQLLHKTGRRVPVLLGLATLDYPNVITVVTDLTPLERSEDTRRRDEDRSRQAQKMDALGTLAGGVAHEFNNLLSVILGNTGMLAADLAPADPMLVILDEVRSAAERAASLTRQLLTFSRHQLIRAEAVDVNALIAAAKPDIRSLLGDGVSLVYAPTPSLPPVLTDGHHLREAILNLVANARDAMPAGGTLRIETRSATVGEDARRLDVAPGNYVVLSVSDTGLGMDPATRARLFEPFFTTKPLGQGTGLGLAMVFGLVRQSNGSIRVETETSKGSTFHLYLPAGR